MPNLRVFSIPAAAPFLPTLIRALMAGELVPGFPARGDPLALAAATLYVPTRRACRRSLDFFLNEIESDAAILPRIVALGDIDEDEIVFAQAATGELAAPALEMQAPIAPLERRLLLAQLVLKWASGIAPLSAAEAALVPTTPLAALALADDLARLMDDMITRGVPWERFDKLVPDEFDRYWQLTLDFLKIARVAWPDILKERGVIEPAARRDALLRAEAARLASGRAGPVIAAGSTGSMPATADLLAMIAKLPNGAVVLPGLDKELDDEAWAMIGGSEVHPLHRPSLASVSFGRSPSPAPLRSAGEDGGLGSASGRLRLDWEDESPAAVSHPQFAMHTLLRRMGITREQVIEIGETQAASRARLVSEAMRPAAATHRWQALSLPQDTIETISVIEAAHAEEEALAIAIALREAVEENKTTALVTPDRGLARRVCAALARWNLHADDSGGEPLVNTPAGSFACLATEAALLGLAPVTLLAFLKHPLMRLARARAIATLEKAVLRGPRPRPGSANLAHALAAFREELAKVRKGEPSDVHPSEPRARLSERELSEATELVERLERAFSELETMPPQPQPLTQVAARHSVLIGELSSDASPTLPSPLQGEAVDRVRGEAGVFSGHDGVQLAQVFEEIAALAADADMLIAPADYPEFFKSLISDRVVRIPEAADAQIRIYGPLEARLQRSHRVVLGGLIEGVWPPEGRSDAWLSRPMRRTLGLDLPERRISLSAHDFAENLAAPEVVLAYASRVAGAPTVISRFVQRFTAVTGEKPWAAARARGEKYVRWARALDQPRTQRRIEKPRPTPPRAARPTSLSVTEIETWLRDPYSIYAKHILKLPALDPIDLEPGASNRGILLHAMLGDFSTQFRDELPKNAAEVLLRMAERHFTALEDFPEARAFWWPRLVRIAHWFAAWDAGRRARAASIIAEVSGRIPIPLDNERAFTLRARADRIEQCTDGRYAILDFKTGTVPSDKQVQVGFSPQLSLEAAILRNGGFSEIPAGASVAELVYVSLKGGEPAGEQRTVKLNEPSCDAHAARALAKLCSLIVSFDNDDQPYLPLVRPMWKARYGPYDHLARVKEWSVGEDEEQAAE
jgi:ATP-dependent helicase/nuclease subunit B